MVSESVDLSSLIDSLKKDIEWVSGMNRPGDTLYNKGWDSGFRDALRMVIERYEN